VCVIPGVAGFAATRLMHLALRRLDVAGETVETRVGSGKRERSLDIVIEAPDSPPIRYVAATATVAEPLFVPVLFGVTAGAAQVGVAKTAAVVAALAGDECVKAQQRKLRELVVERYLAGPIPLAVTRTAIPTLLTSVSVFGPMTRVAAHCDSLLSERSFVTRVTARVGVGAAQWKFGVAVVVESGVLPRNRPVAVATSRSVAPPVFIVEAMAGGTVRGELLGCRVAAMAAPTRELQMSPPEVEAGLRAVVEARALPSHRCMAVTARAPQAAPVRVIEFVAGTASSGRSRVALIGVA
jgi:hypothetical protein